jgi:hypothetical protein
MEHWVGERHGVGREAAWMTAHPVKTRRETAHFGSAAFEVNSVARSAGVRICKVGCSVINYPIGRMFSRIWVKPHLRVRAAASGSGNDERAEQEQADFFYL